MKKNQLIFLFLLLILSAVIQQGCKKESDELPPETDINWNGFIRSDPDSVLMIPIGDTSMLSQDQRIRGFEPSFSLTMPPVKNQGPDEASCCAFAAVYATRSYHLYRDHKLTEYESGLNTVMSPSYVFNQLKQGVNCDIGVPYLLVFQMLSDKGVCTWAKMPWAGYSDCATQPNAEQNDNAEYFITYGAYRISDLTPGNLKAYIHHGYPIMFGIDVDSGFVARGKNRIPGVWNSKVGKIKGAHAMVLCGWDDARNAYKIMNSAGQGWGENGFAWIDYDYFRQKIMEEAGSTGAYEVYWLKTKYNKRLITKPTAREPENIDSTSATLKAASVKLPEEAPLLKRGIKYGKTFNVMTVLEATDLTDILFSFEVDDLEPDTHYEVIAYTENVYGRRYDTLEGGFRTLPSNVPEKTYCLSTFYSECQLSANYCADLDSGLCKYWKCRRDNYFSLVVSFNNNIPVSGIFTYNKNWININYLNTSCPIGEIVGECGTLPPPEWNTAYCPCKDEGPLYPDYNIVTFNGNDFSSSDLAVTGTLDGSIIVISINGDEYLIGECP